MEIRKQFSSSQSSSIEASLGMASPPLRHVLENAIEGRELSIQEGLTLARAEAEDLRALVAAADYVRQKKSGEVITYIINRNINFTNKCIIGCRFCAFSHSEDMEPQEDEFLLTPDEVAGKSLEAQERGAIEVCVQGGLPRKLDPYYYRDVLIAIRKKTPAMHTHAFSPMEIIYGTRLTRMSLREYLVMLVEAGLDTMPGTAAEILDDSVRHEIERAKLTVTQWVDVIKQAHSLGIKTTSTMMYGHTETTEHWLRHMSLIREIQKETGGFTEFVPLGFIHHNTQLYQSGSARPGPTVEEHLRVHALSRLFFQGLIDNIQVSWVKMPRETVQACLKAGANDYGGTLMEESISRLAGAETGEYMAPEEFRERILELGRIPAERNTTYTVIKTIN
jgi:FO synthase